MVTPPFQIKRHYRRLSEKETDTLVDATAELIVNYVKGGRKNAALTKKKQERTHEQGSRRETKPTI